MEVSKRLGGQVSGAVGFSGVVVDHASNHYAFNLLFTLAFFASLAVVMVRFG